MEKIQLAIDIVEVILLTSIIILLIKRIKDNKK